MKPAFLLTLAAAAVGLTAHAAAPVESHKIDDILSQEWQKNHLSPNAPASDATIVRRLYLDIAGRIPSLEETKAFLESKDPAKREHLIDQLLASDGFTSNMFNYWADLLRLTDNVKGRVTAQAYAEWMKGQIKGNVPYDQMVRSLMTTEGGAWDSGAIGFYQRDDNKLDHLAYTVQVFLGTSIVCAQCHDHPFDKWTQMDYYGMAAYTYGMNNRGGLDGIRKGKGAGAALKGLTKEERRKKLAEEGAKTQMDRAQMQEVSKALRDITKPLRYVAVSYDDTQSPALPADYRYTNGKPGQRVEPKVIFGHDATPEHGQTRISAFADWMTSPDNPRFTEVIANRMWKKVFGLALIEPVDEITDSTVASNTELMDYLTQLMADKKYSIRDFLRVLYNTETYQRTASHDEVALGDAYHFTGPLLRRMGAEQIWDSLVMLTKGNVDGETSEENQQLHKYLDDLKVLTNTLRTKDRGELLEVAKRSNDANSDNQKKIEELRQQAKASGDKTALQEAVKEAGRLRKESSSEILTAIVGEDMAQELRRGYAEGRKNKAGKAELTAEMKAQLAALSKEQRRMAIQLGSTVNLNHRASEVSSPAKPGHFLRIFGQSDRELIQNANDDASVPQALAMLNGPVADMLNNPLSTLRLELAKSATPQEKMENLYMAFLSRKPDAHEKEILDHVIQDRGDMALADVTHALLTGSQFLFIQ